MITRVLPIKSQQQLSDIFGPLDENIHTISKAFNVSIRVGKNCLKVKGKTDGVQKALSAINSLKNGNGRVAQCDPESSPENTNDNCLFRSYKGQEIFPNSPVQKKYIASMEKNPITIAIGPAGTGKTFLAVMCGLKYVFQGKFSKIILSRPIVEAGERLGFLPGDFEEKVCPYLAPLYDAFRYLIGTHSFNRNKKNGVIEIVPLAYMRGRTLDNAFIILDEAQNTTVLQMKMILTRLGSRARAVINGDITQIDIAKGVESGLVHARKVLKNIRGINFIQFTRQDVVRHPLVKKIVAAYSSSGDGRRETAGGET